MLPAGSTEHFQGGQVSCTELLGSKCSSAQLGVC